MVLLTQKVMSLIANDITFLGFIRLWSSSPEGLLGSLGSTFFPLKYYELCKKAEKHEAELRG